MAEKVDKTAPVLPLSMEGEKKKKKKQALSSVLDDLLPTVRDVVLWTLFNAGNITFSCAISAAYCMLIDSIFSHPALAAHAPSWLMPSAAGEMTDAEEAEALALIAGMLWCAVPQAAAGVLALTLPSHRRRLRLLLAYAAHVATAAGHYMFIVVHGMFVAADPGDLFFRAIGTVVIVALGMDLLCFLVLLLRGREE